MNALKNKTLALWLASAFAFFACFLLPSNRRLALMIAGSLLLSATLFYVIRALYRHEKACRQILVFGIAILLAASACVCAWHFEKYNLLTAKSYIDNGEHSASGYVTEVLYEKPFGSSYIVVTEQIDVKSTKMKIVLTSSMALELQEGDSITFIATFSETEEEYRTYYRSRGILASAEADAEEITVTGVHQESAFPFFKKSSDFLSKQYQRVFEDDESASSFTQALVLGKRETLDDKILLDFRRAGVSHLLAISGLHLSILVGAIDFFLRKIRAGFVIRHVVLLAVPLFFAFLCGLSASILRAAIMLTIYYFAEVIGEKSDSVTSLFIALTIILAVNPYAVFDAAFWLSFTATFGILLVFPALTDRRKNKSAKGMARFFENQFSMFVMTLAATAFSLPATWLLFGGISILSPLSNFLFIPIIQILLYLLLALLTLSWLPVVPQLLARLCGYIIDALIWGAEKLSFIRGVYVSLRYPFVPYLTVALLLGIAVIFFLPKIRLRRFFALIGAFILAFGLSVSIYEFSNREAVIVTSLSDEKSDGVLFTHRSKTIFIDSSTGGATVPNRALDVMEEQCRTEIDLLVLTHYHRYHVGTLARLTNKVLVRELMLPMAENEKDCAILASILSLVKDDCKITMYSRQGESLVSCGRLTLSLAAQEYLSRSVQPLIAFSARVDSAPMFTYVSSAGFESENYLILAGQSRVIFAGANGAVVKHIYQESVFDDVDVVIFASEETSNRTELQKQGVDFRWLTDSDGILTIRFE